MIQNFYIHIYNFICFFFLQFTLFSLLQIFYAQIGELVKNAGTNQ